MLDHMLDYVLDHMLDHMLDQMIIGLVIMALHISRTWVKSTLILFDEFSKNWEKTAFYLTSRDVNFIKIIITF